MMGQFKISRNKVKLFLKEREILTNAEFVNLALTEKIGWPITSLKS